MTIVVTEQILCRVYTYIYIYSCICAIYVSLFLFIHSLDPARVPLLPFPLTFAYIASYHYLSKQIAF